MGTFAEGNATQKIHQREQTKKGGLIPFIFIFWGKKPGTLWHQRICNLSCTFCLKTPEE
jgi:hypothetical protein